MIGGMAQFIRETRQELKKVSWPSREELVGATGVVIFTTFILAVFVGGVDFCLTFLIRFLIR